MRNRLLLLLSMLGVCGCAAPRDGAAAARTDDPLPAHGSAPSDPELLLEIEAALDRRLRRDFDRFLDAREPGELLEHAVLTQVELEKAGLGIEALFIIGDELFDYEFRPEHGLGNGLQGRAGSGSLPAPNLRRVHRGEFGGPESHNCSSCHLKGGVDGAGAITQNAFLRSDGASTLAADARNPPHLLGLGPVEALAREMTAVLKAASRRAGEAARLEKRPVEVALEAKGIGFGLLRALPDGTVDSSWVEGIDADLVVKPFGWKGHQADLRGMVEESFRIHMGILSMRDQERVRDGDATPAVYGDGIWHDADRDGTTLEVDEGMLTTMVVYLSQLEAPVIRPPRTDLLVDHFARGEAVFREAGCDACHRPVLELEDPVLEVRPRGVQAAEMEPIRVDVSADGEHPKVEPRNARRTAFNVRLFSDLKRHDMGPDLATPREQNGIPPSVFLTRPLWGLAFTAPYLHDGRAPTLDDAIRLHDGEAAASRERYLASAPADRAALQVFLLSLTREPKLAVP